MNDLQFFDNFDKEFGIFQKALKILSDFFRENVDKI